MILTGQEAIAYATLNELALNKYADPTEDARGGVSIEEASKIASEDPSLIWIESTRILPTHIIARWKAEDWDDEKMIASEYTYEDADTREPIELTETEAREYSWGQTADDCSGGSQAGSLGDE